MISRECKQAEIFSVFEFAFVVYKFNVKSDRQFSYGCAANMKTKTHKSLEGETVIEHAVTVTNLHVTELDDKGGTAVPLLRYCTNRNTASVGTNMGLWYECSSCNVFLSSKVKYLLHVDKYHRQLHEDTQLFYVNDKCGVTINQVGSPQLFVPKITMKPFEDTCDAALCVFPTLNVTLMRLSYEEIESIKTDLSYIRHLRSRLTPRTNSTSMGNRSNAAESDSNEIVEQDLKRLIKNQQRRLLRVIKRESVYKRKPSSTAKCVCPTCGIRVSGLKRMPGHLAMHTFTRCTICRKKLHGEEHTAKHMKSHKAMEERKQRKTLECNVCHARFVHKENLIQHFTKHIDNNPFRCKICGLQTTRKYHLQRHLALHFETENEKLECQFCGKKFTRLEAVRRHHLRVHADNGDNSRATYRRGTHRVERILYSGATKNVLDLAPSVHSPKRIAVDEATGKVKTEVKTEVCQESEDVKHVSPAILTPSDLIADVPGSWQREAVLKMKQSGMDVQSSGRAYTSKGTPNSYFCKFCSDSFSRFFALRVHMKAVHPQEFVKENTVDTMRLICSDCGFTCVSTNELATHMETEHGKPIVPQEWFPCKLCRTRCKSQERLDRHFELLHHPSAEPKYACKGHCDKKFFTVDNLRKHRRRFYLADKDADRVHCPECGKEEPNNRALAKHNRRFHDSSRVLSVCKLCNERCCNISSLRRHIHLVHGNGKYRRNKGKEHHGQSKVLSEDQLFL